MEIWAKGHVGKGFKGNSGNGSALSYNRPYIDFLRQFIREKEIKSVVDVGCGDWRCGIAIYGGLDVQYTGYDVYADMIASHKQTYPAYNFIHQDGSKNTIPADLIIVKDVIQHWTDRDAITLLKSLKGKYKHALITNCGEKADKGSHIVYTGCWRPLPFPTHPIWRGVEGEIVLTYDTKEVVSLDLGAGVVATADKIVDGKP